MINLQSAPVRAPVNRLLWRLYLQRAIVRAPISAMRVLSSPVVVHRAFPY